jgi:hypothetical protein
MTEVATRDQHSAVPAVPAAMPSITDASMPGLAVLDQWLRAASTAQKLVGPLVDSAFVPAAFKPSGPNGREVAVANATSAVLLGMSLGVDPLTALQNIYVVHGRPGMYSKFKVALALAAGHEVTATEWTPEAVTVVGRRKGWPEDRFVQVRITMADAERAGWATTNANYKKTPADMLYARAAGRVVDQIAADTLAGIASVEDLDDVPEPAQPVRRVELVPAPVAPAAHNDVVDTAAAAAGTSSETLRAALAASQPAPAPAAPAPAAAPEPPADSPAEPITEPQLRKLSAVLGGHLGIGGPGSREERLRIVSAVVARPLTTSKDLTKREAQVVIDSLEGTTKAKLYEIIGAPPAAPDGEHEQPPAPGDEQLSVEDPPADPYGDR